MKHKVKPVSVLQEPLRLFLACCATRSANHDLCSWDDGRARFVFLRATDAKGAEEMALGCHAEFEPEDDLDEHTWGTMLVKHPERGEIAVPALYLGDGGALDALAVAWVREVSEHDLDLLRWVLGKPEILGEPE